MKPVPFEKALVHLGLESVAVAHVGSADPEDDVFRHVGGVVGDALQTAGNEEQVDGGAGGTRILRYALKEYALGPAVHVVHGVIHGQYAGGQFGVPIG